MSSTHTVRNKVILGQSMVENLKCPVQEFDSVNIFYRKMTESKWYFEINLNAENRKGSKRKSPNAIRINNKDVSYRVSN